LAGVEVLCLSGPALAVPPSSLLALPFGLPFALPFALPFGSTFLSAFFFAIVISIKRLRRVEPLFDHPPEQQRRG
jgi:hypothetical protein